MRNPIAMPESRSTIARTLCVFVITGVSQWWSIADNPYLLLWMNNLGRIRLNNITGISYQGSGDLENHNMHLTVHNY